ncbi:arginine--tRNA ligase [bacterium CG2_30_37_16]|nr:MAG: arginine--tRNA ligase [bacterium CG2_30_37_16]PIP30445.1 MAG: arginine--tRNA ligase [bacterium (Candidatus Howlettbacteria) CG23_combo_of_CG06-09_8_20_14_all_37_9]PIX99952.1 MAG: arginine--tRNA ligase [bacterium (Candidatus Howlettbacteria) CG_4_10_14_3_um_filter_37_10]PJB05805.1 MAG: arginine--tRNA ligase [bacterium (Candidatus Howlettbacteria) CG_4_9_14_3_um_filter_37_10]
MLKEDLRKYLVKELKEMAQKGIISDFEENDFQLERPREEKHGDFSTNFALKQAKDETPFYLATKIKEHLKVGAFISKTDVVHPGFINFHFIKEVYSGELYSILEKRENYGNLEKGTGKNVSIDYLSANPTGPVHIGNARGIIGYNIANVLEKSGYKVTKEFWINDIGGQAERFARTLYYWYQVGEGIEATFPEGGYPGKYYEELSNKVVQPLDKTKLSGLSEEELIEMFRKSGLKLSVEGIKNTMEKIGVHFDKWVSQEFIQTRFTDETFEYLNTHGYTQEKDGAVWFISKDFQDFEDKESVLKKSDQKGTYTYFMDDIAYHWARFKKENIDIFVDVLGSNHHGHLPRMKAALKAIGVPENNLKHVLYQYVRLKKGDEITRMAKREGTYVTADDVLAQIPADVLKFFFLLRAPDSHLDFDLELAKDTSDKNPLYYVQYSLARMHGIKRQASASDGQAKETDYKDANLTLLTEPEEISLIKKLTAFPEIIDEVGENFQIQRLPYYAVDLANGLHSFYEKHRVLNVEEELSASRLALLEAVIIVMKEVLRLIGVDAPEKM